MSWICKLRMTSLGKPIVRVAKGKPSISKQQSIHHYTI